MNYELKKEYFATFAELFENMECLNSFDSVEQIYALIEVLEISCANEIESLDREFTFNIDKFYKACKNIVSTLYDLRSDLRDIAKYGESFR